MIETNWSLYGQCETCFAPEKEACKSMKGSGELTRVHRGRAKLPSITAEQAEETQPLDTVEAFVTPTDGQRVHKMSVARSQVTGGLTVWQSTCSCGEWQGSMWTDDASAKKEFEARHMGVLLG